MRRPNILLFITDQHRADWLGCYGHPIVRTPNIDAIAGRGVAFEDRHLVVLRDQSGVGEARRARADWRSTKTHPANRHRRPRTGVSRISVDVTKTTGNCAEIRNTSTYEM